MRFCMSVRVACVRACVQVKSARWLAARRRVRVRVAQLSSHFSPAPQTHHRRRRTTAILHPDPARSTLLVALIQAISDCMVRGKKFRFRLKKNPEQLFECMDNIQSSLNYLEQKGIVIVNIGAGDIYHGNMKITLGLIWTLIQTYQIDANQGIGEAQAGAAPKLEEPKLCTGAHLLLEWCQTTVASYVASGLGARPHDFAGSFSSGVTLSCLIHAHFPTLVDLSVVGAGDARANLELVMVVASKHLGIPRMLDPEDVDMLLTSPHSVSKVVQLCVRRLPACPCRVVHSHRVVDALSLRKHA